MSKRRCPWCAEEIAAEAKKCPHCRSWLGPTGDRGGWHRGHPERRLAGVCAAIAHGVGTSVTGVRVAFLLLAFLHGFGIWVYAILWFLLPGGPAAPSGLDRLVEAVRAFARALGGDAHRVPTASSAPRGETPSDAGREADAGSAGEWSRTRS